MNRFYIWNKNDDVKIILSDLKDIVGPIIFVAPTTEDLQEIKNAITKEEKVKEYRETSNEIKFILNGRNFYGLILGGFEYEKIRGARPAAVLVNNYEDCDKIEIDEILFGLVAAV